MVSPGRSKSKGSMESGLGGSPSSPTPTATGEGNMKKKPKKRSFLGRMNVFSRTSKSSISSPGKTQRSSSISSPASAIKVSTTDALTVSQSSQHTKTTVSSENTSESMHFENSPRSGQSSHFFEAGSLEGSTISSTPDSPGNGQIGTLKASQTGRFEPPLSRRSSAPRSASVLSTGRVVSSGGPKDATGTVAKQRKAFLKSASTRSIGDGTSLSPSQSGTTNRRRMLKKSLTERFEPSSTQPQMPRSSGVSKADSLRSIGEGSSSAANSSKPGVLLTPASAGSNTRRKRVIRKSLIGRVEAFSKADVPFSFSTPVAQRPRLSMNVPPALLSTPTTTGSIGQRKPAPRRSVIARLEEYSKNALVSQDPVVLRTRGDVKNIVGGASERVEAYAKNASSSKEPMMLRTRGDVKKMVGGASERVEAYTKNASSSKEPMMLRTRGDVKKIVRRKSEQSQQRFDKIRNQYNTFAMEQSLQKVQNLKSAKDRQRNHFAALATKNRKRTWESARHELGGILDPSSAAYREVVAADVNVVGFNEVRAVNYDFTDFVPPVHEKSLEEKLMIIDVIERTFCFSEFHKQGRARIRGGIDALVDAFEPIYALAGDVLLHEGIREGNDKFYILEEGSIDFLTHGVSVGKATPGESFGELSLLYQMDSATTISVDYPSRDNQASSSSVAKLFSLNQKVFRGLLRTYIDLANQEKREAIGKVDFLQDIFEGEKSNCSLAHQLAAVMIRHEFRLDQSFTVQEDSTFFLMQEGNIKVENASGTLNFSMYGGDYFGERALIGSLPKRSMVSTVSTFTGVSPEGGVYFTIKRETMERILGPSRLQKLHDIQCLLKSNVTKDLLSFVHPQIDNIASSTLVDSVEEISLVPASDDSDSDCMRIEETDPPALYLIREGEVVVTTKDEVGNVVKRNSKAGDIIGHEFLEERTITTYSMSVGMDGAMTRNPIRSSSIVRKAGFTAQLKGEDAATITACRLDNEGKTNSLVPNQERRLSTKARPKRRSSTEMKPRDKVRAAVKCGLSLEDFEKIKLLGEGEFGEVWLVAADIYMTGMGSSRKEFALKTQFKDDCNRGTEAVDAIRREIEVIQAFDHPQLADLVNVYEDDTNIHMLMGLIPGGELWNHIYKEDEQGEWTCGLPEAEARFYTYVVADTLGYMHSKGFIFRDLKPENIMIDSEGYPVIVDFGFAKACPEGDMTWTFCGTPNYVAPEVITNSGHNRGVDFWALGVTLYEMVAGENPFFFEGMDQISLYDTICRDPHYPLKNEDEMSLDLVPLIDGLLEKDPIRRLGMLSNGIDDVLGHPWFDELDLTLIREKRWQAPTKSKMGAAASAEETTTSILSNMNNSIVSIEVPSQEDMTRESTGDARQGKSYFSDVSHCDTSHSDYELTRSCRSEYEVASESERTVLEQPEKAENEQSFVFEEKEELNGQIPSSPTSRELWEGYQETFVRDYKRDAKQTKHSTRGGTIQSEKGREGNNDNSAYSENGLVENNDETSAGANVKHNDQYNANEERKEPSESLPGEDSKFSEDEKDERASMKKSKTKKKKKSNEMDAKTDEKHFRINYAKEALDTLLEEGEAPAPENSAFEITVKNPTRRMTKTQKRKSVMRKSAVSGALNGFGLKDLGASISGDFDDF